MAIRLAATGNAAATTRMLRILSRVRGRREPPSLRAGRPAIAKTSQPTNRDRCGQGTSRNGKERLGWDRLISLFLTDNIASKAVARRLGGVHERTIAFRGELADIFVYRM